LNAINLSLPVITDGQKDLAIKNYEKALELNPNNTNAQKVIKDMKRTK
jgi:Tfp pilus assembly protein PilF